MRGSIRSKSYPNTAATELPVDSVVFTFEATGVRLSERGSGTLVKKSDSLEVAVRPAGFSVRIHLLLRTSQGAFGGNIYKLISIYKGNIVPVNPLAEISQSETLSNAKSA